MRHAENARRTGFKSAAFVTAAALIALFVLGLASKQTSNAVPLALGTSSVEQARRLPEVRPEISAVVSPAVQVAGDNVTEELPQGLAEDLVAMPAEAEGEVVPASVPALSPHGALAETAPASLELAAAVDDVSPSEPEPLAAPSAEDVSAVPVEASLTERHGRSVLRVLEPDPAEREFQLVSRIETVRLAAPRQAVRAVEIAALPGEVQPAMPPAEAPAARPDEPLLLTVSLLEQKLNVYRGIELIETSKVSSGARGHETRTGVFSILEKQRYHHSNLYSNAPMPWMQRLTRSGTALHAGVVPNYPASHGCIRLPFSFAPKLYKITDVGANVVVAGAMPEPKLIAHSNLFHPAAVQADEAAKPGDAARPLRMLVTRRTERDTLISVQQSLAELGYLQPQNFTGNRGSATIAAIKAFQKAKDLRPTGELDDALVKAIHEAAGKPELPDGYLFVRQGYKRLFETPVAFRNPAQPLGTHVFTALQFAPGDAEVPWAAATVEGGDAAAALDRIEIPEDAREKIAALLTPGATFIIAETSEYSAILPEGDDFIISATEVPSSGPKVAVSAPSSLKPPSVKKARRKARIVTAPRQEWQYRSPPQRVRRGFFFRW